MPTISFFNLLEERGAWTWSLERDREIVIIIVGNVPDTKLKVNSSNSSMNYSPAS